MIEAIPQGWWCTPDYDWRVKDPHGKGVVTHAVWDWCSMTFGSMTEGGWCDQGAYMCFKHHAHAAIFCMTWYGV